MQYNYTAKDSNGISEKGKIDAANSEQAIEILAKKGLIALKVNEARSFGLNFFNKKISLRDRIIFSRELAVMIRSGLSVTQSLDALTEQTTNQYFAQKIKAANDDVKGGMSLSESIARQKDLFPQLFVSMINSGEKSGKLDDVLEKLAKQLEDDYNLYSKVKSALTYPAVLVVGIIIVLFIVVIYVIPQLKTIFTEMNVPLPVGTKILLAVSDFIQKWFALVIIAFIALIYGLKQLIKIPKVKTAIDIIKLKLPVFGGFYKKIYVARISRTIASLISSGLPFLEIFKIVEQIIENDVYKKSLAKVSKDLEAGVQLSNILKNDPIFPKMLGSMVAVGEASGKLDETFATVADFYESEIDITTKNLTTLIEPIMMIFMGIVIALMISAVMMPIYNLVNQIQ